MDLSLLLRLYVLFFAVTWNVVVTSDTTSVEQCLEPALECREQSPATCTDVVAEPDAYIKARMNTFVKQNCFCDAECLAAGDCCPDYRRKNEEGNSNNDKGVNNLRSDVDESGIDESTVACVKSSNMSLDVKLFSISVVHKCPASWTDKVTKNLCESTPAEDDVFLQWPVSIHASKLVYKNIYCATCNGVAGNATYWLANVTCKFEYKKNIDDESLSEIISDNQVHLTSKTCKVTFKSPTNNFRFCKISVDYCPPSWMDSCTKQLCEGENPGVAYVYDMDKQVTYKNVHCAKCNGVPADKLVCSDYRMRELFMTFGRRFSPTKEFYPLTMLLDLNSMSGTVHNHNIGHSSSSVKQIQTCDVMQVFDPFQGQCRNVSCGPGYQFVSGNCVKETGYGSSADSVEQGCLKEVHNTGEYHLLSHGAVYINMTKTTLTYGSYDIHDNVLYVCTNLTQNGTSNIEISMKFDQAQTILSICGQLLSLIALSMHFIVYSLIPKLQNLPGKNLMCLVAALFVTQLLFLVGMGRNENYGGCVVVAVMIHYCFLAAFCWMNVMSFAIFRTFWHQLVHRPSTTSVDKKFCRYSVYAWTAPAVIVVISLIVNFTLDTSNPYRPAYGEGLCWINHRPALGVFFAAPVAAILVANFAFFSLMIYSICRVTKDTKVARAEKGTNKKLMVLYLKLTTIMGLTWIFGFIASAADVSVLWYFFLVFNSLQGVFIFVSFVCTRKVMKLLRDRVDILRSKPREKESLQSYYTRTSRLTSQSSYSETNRRSRLASQVSMSGAEDSRDSKMISEVLPSQNGGSKCMSQTKN